MILLMESVQYSFNFCNDFGEWIGGIQGVAGYPCGAGGLEWDLKGIIEDIGSWGHGCAGRLGGLVY